MTDIFYSSFACFSRSIRSCQTIGAYGKRPYSIMSRLLYSIGVGLRQSCELFKTFRRFLKDDITIFTRIIYLNNIAKQNVRKNVLNINADSTNSTTTETISMLQC